MPALAKLVLFSSMVHQTAFSLLSTLPFAIGQVQDAGLIFLSRMTTDVAKHVLLRGGTAEEAVATALTATAFATASLGVALVIIGKLKLARFVAYLPMPVVGGYLAFIGLFCLEAALGLSSGKDIQGVGTWGVLLNSRGFLLCVPCLVIGVLWSWVSRRYQHFSVLPISMLAVPALFFVVLWLSGQSMQTARDYGLIGPITQPAELSWSFSLFRFGLVHWSVLPALTPVWIGMIFVVAFSSSLDVAAIEIDMGEPLDTNKELNTVGWSNIFSGLTGGFTGSYIFSQTLFTRRTNCPSRLIGWVVTVSELAVCVITVDPLAYVPLLFFAATLSFIAVELSVEWLWEIREKLLAHEYLVLLATFVAIQIVGLNQGLVVGVGLSTLFFVISYASERRNTLERVHKRGRFMRPASQRRLLQVHRDKILCVELRGELFFGSSQQVLQQVTTMLGLATPSAGKRAKEAAATAAAAGGAGGSSANGGGGAKEDTPNEVLQRWCGRALKAVGKFFMARAARTRGGSTPSRGSRSRTASSRSNSLGGDGDDERRPLFAAATANGASLSLSHGSLSSTTAANTSSNMTSNFGVTTTGGSSSASAGGGGGSSRAPNLGGGSSSSRNGSSGSVASGSALSRFSKPTKAVSFAGDDDPNSDASGGGAGTVLDRNGYGDFSSSGRAALEDRSPDRSPVRSPLRGSRLAALPQGLGFAGMGLGGTVSDIDEGHGGADGVVHGSDGYGWGFGEKAGSITSSTQGVSGGEDVDEDEDSEMANFIVLDCSKVTNIDASAARTCFLPLQRVTEAHGVCIAYAGLTDRMETLLSVHKAIGRDNVAVFKTFFAAVDWCETQLIRSVAAYEEDGSASFWATSHFSRRESFKSSAVTIKQLLRQILDLPESASAVDGIERYCSQEDYEAGEVIFSPGDEADSFYVVTDGQVLVEKSPDGSCRPQELRGEGKEDRKRANSAARAGGQVLFNVGAIFGYVDYQLEERRAHSAIAATDAVVTVFTRTGLDRMLEENPRLLCLVERSVMKHLALELTNLPYCLVEQIKRQLILYERLATMTMDGGDVPPQKHFIHTQAAHFTAIFFFYAYGNTPPTDLLQHIPHDAPRADILSLGCSDLRDLLYSILLHGRRGVSCGSVPRQTNFVINDWEPAIHARNLMLLQLILDSRHLLQDAPAAGGAGGVAGGMGGDSVPSTSDRGKGNASGRKKPPKASSKKKAPISKETQGKAASRKPSRNTSSNNAAFAQRIGAIFCAMYNMFVDADALEMIYDVAGRLAALAASPEEWASSELGKIVRFADDRSRDRVRKILARYTDGSLQDKGVFKKIRDERTAFLATYFHDQRKPSIISRAMGLASLCQGESIEPNAKMRRHYLRQGILDPYPLLLDETGDSPAPRKGKGPFKKVNPLLLVTERKGSAPSLHYGAFPLDAFHTDVSWWKLQPDNRQEEYGMLAPQVTKPREASHSNERGALSIEARQSSWFGAALEELAQMCGAFLAATGGTRAAPQTGSASDASGGGAPHLSVTLQVGDSLNFCDALLTAKPSPPDSARAAATGAVFEPVSFQQASVQPLHLRADVFDWPPEFDVISTSNMAEHLGIVNLLVATAPLLKTLPHAVLLTSLMSTLAHLHRYKDTAEFQEKLLCMSPHVAGILLGVVPASNLSTVVGHADTMSLMAGGLGSIFSRQPGESESAPSQLRLAWKRPTAAFAETVAEPDLVDMNPAELVGMTLPIYKAMVPMAGDMGLSKDEWVAKLTMANHYTSVSFVRLVALAGRRLRLSEAHFRAVLDGLMNDSGMLMASNLCQEQMALFHALDLAHIRLDNSGPGRPLPLDTRRIVLLVPKRGLDLLREFSLPGMFMSLTAPAGPVPFDNHFTSVHQAYVRVHRGSRSGDNNLSEVGWRSLSCHLSVRDAREDDSQAELMVSAVVPTATFSMTNPQTEVQLRPRESAEVMNASKDVIRRLGGSLTKVFYKAKLSDADRVAVLPSGGNEAGSGRAPSHGAGPLPPPLACPSKGVTDTPDRGSPATPPQQTRKSGTGQAVLHRSTHGDSAIDRSVELLNQAATGSDARLAYRLTLVMANDHARELMASAEGAPEVAKTRDPCTVRVKLGGGLSVTTRLPFPTSKPSAMRIKMSRRQGYVHLTIPLLRGQLQAAFSLTTYTPDVEGGAPRRSLTLPSTVFWPPCAPLSSLPRLDLKAEWAHNKVMGPFSFNRTELQMRDTASPNMKGGKGVAMLGVKESLLTIAVMGTEKDDDDLPVWPHPWVCLTEAHRDDGPAIWIWLNEVLLDSSNEALVLDCCVMPVSNRIGHAATAQLMESIELQYGSNIVKSKAYPGELELWAALLPVAVERARQSYTHTADCSYAESSDARLTKQSDPSRSLCSCGKGKDLPPWFMHSIELANAMGERVPVHPLFYRAALSPLYVPPDTTAFIDKAMMTDLINNRMTGAAGGAGGAGGGGGAAASSGTACAKCGETGKTLVCTRCKKASYCSKECQVSHWKTHKPACG
eukprot:g5071.t1